MRQPSASGVFENEEITLVEGKTIRVVKDDVIGNEERFTVNHPEAIDSIEVGNYILLENGLMKLEVISKETDGVTCKIINGGVLGNKKSIAVPGVKLNMPFISDQDREDIIFACEHEGDYLALSFVSWSGAFKVSAFEKATESVTNFKLFGFPLFAKILGKKLNVQTSLMLPHIRPL